MSENALVTFVHPLQVCLACRRYSTADAPCEACGCELRGTVAPRVARQPPWLAPSDRDAAVTGTVLMGLLTAILVGGIVLVLVGPETDLRALGMLGTMVAGPSLGIMTWVQRSSKVPLALPPRVGGWWTRARLLTLRLRPPRGPLLLPAAPADATSRIGFEGHIAGDADRVVARAEVWYAPDAPLVPVAWQSTTVGFALELDDGRHVDVPAGLLGLDVPEDHPRIASTCALHPGRNDRFLLVTIELRGGQRIRLRAEVEMTSPSGYRGESQRWTVRGVATAEIVPGGAPDVEAA